MNSLCPSVGVGGILCCLSSTSFILVDWWLLPICDAEIHKQWQCSLLILPNLRGTRESRNFGARSFSLHLPFQNNEIRNTSWNDQCCHLLLLILPFMCVHCLDLFGLVWSAPSHFLEVVWVKTKINNLDGEWDREESEPPWKTLRFGCQWV